MTIPLKYSEEEVQVVDGVLCFIDAQTMDQYLKQLMEMPDSLRNIQETAWGFTSYASIFDSINDYIASASTENEMLQRINANSAFVCIKDSSLVSQLPSFGHHYIANADGIFKADSTYYRIFRQGIAAWRGASLNQMKNLTLNGDFDEDPADGKYFYLKDVTIEPTENNCGNSKSVEKYTNSGWYRVLFEVKVNIIPGEPTICEANNTWITHSQYACIVSVKGQVKRFWIWFGYNSLLEFKEIYCQLVVPRRGNNYNSANCTWNYFFELGGVNNKNSIQNGKLLERFYKHNIEGMGDMTQNYTNLPNPVFLKVKGKGKSAAFGANDWAEINCGY